MSAEETVQLFLDSLDGRPGARDRLLERLRPRLLLWSTGRLSHRLRGRVEPEDVVQEILVRVNGSLGAFQGREFAAFRGWLFTLAHNTIRDLAKYHGAQKRQPVELRSDTQTSPSQGAMRHEELERMKTAIAALRPAERDVVCLRVFEDLSHAEVATRMGRTEGAVRILYCRALKSLRRWAEGGAPEGAA